MIYLMELSSLTALSPLDGRYQDKVVALQPFLSEFGLIRYRVFVEIQWLIFLSEEVNVVSDFSKAARQKLEKLMTDFTLSEAKAIKTIEKKTNHDVKAVEYYLQEHCQKEASLKSLVPFIHFGCTSEDINNLAYAFMIKDSRDKVLAPALQNII